MIEPTLEEVVAIAERVVAARSEAFVYTKKISTTGPVCLYVHDDKPDCLVGHILHELGVPLKVLATFEGESSWQVLYQLHHREVLRVDLDIDGFLTHLQLEQDSGNTWGAALEIAKRKARPE